MCCVVLQSTSLTAVPDEVAEDIFTSVLCRVAKQDAETVGEELFRAFRRFMFFVNGRRKHVQLGRRNDYTVTVRCF